MLEILKKYWGYDSFRGIQEDIINSISSGKDTLGLMPTGGGKSITFQVPALAMDGLCLVITPLISLMKDQVDNLRKRGIIAYAIYSGMSHDDIVSTLDNCIFGKAKFLYLSPERLESSFFITKLLHLKICFVAVDEAHCISQWGYDFRPSYLKIAEIRKYLPGKPVLALTATATPRVVDDIQDKLHFKKKNAFRMSFERKNLTYVVRFREEKESELLHILNKIPGTSIIYVRSRKNTHLLSNFLNSNGIQSAAYHAGMTLSLKEDTQRKWQKNEYRVIVATNAFGMGIDKPDVRSVIHFDIPSSLEAYYQEAGRAGRDGKPSYAIALCDKNIGISLKRFVNQAFPSRDFIAKVYDYLAYKYEIGVGMGAGRTYIFDLYEFSREYNLSMRMVQYSLQLLHQAGYIIYDPQPDEYSRLKILLPRTALDNIPSLTRKESYFLTLFMRSYSGVFTDYVYFRENDFVQMMDVTHNELKDLLKELSHKRIIRYVPPRRNPLITYNVNRVEGNDIILKKSIYEDRKRHLLEQTDSVTHYLMNDSLCRSRHLSMYFGEKRNDSCDCGRCDVCLKLHKVHSINIENRFMDNDPRNAVIKFLSDGNLHKPQELRELPYSMEIIQYTVDELMAENYILLKSGRLSINKTKIS